MSRTSGPESRATVKPKDNTQRMPVWDNWKLLWTVRLLARQWALIWATWLPQTCASDLAGADLSSPAGRLEPPLVQGQECSFVPGRLLLSPKWPASLPVPVLLAPSDCCLRSSLGFRGSSFPTLPELLPSSVSFIKVTTLNLENATLRSCQCSCSMSVALGHGGKLEEQRLAPEAYFRWCGRGGHLGRQLTGKSSSEEGGRLVCSPSLQPQHLLALKQSNYRCWEWSSAGAGQGH